MKTKTSVKQHPSLKVRWIHIALALFFVALILVILLPLQATWSSYQKAMAQQALELAQSAEAMLHTQLMQSVTGTGADIDDENYLQLKKSMDYFKQNNPIVDSMVLLTLRQNVLILMVDSQWPGDEGYHAPGDLWGEDIYARQVLQGDAGHWLGKRQDTQGQWMTVYVPVTNPDSGAVLAVLGMNYSPAQWNSVTNRQLTRVAIMVAAFSAMALFAVWMVRQNLVLSRMGQRLRNSEELFRAVFEQAPVGIIIGYGDKRVEMVNDRTLGILKHQFSDAKSIDWDAITHPEDKEKNDEYFQNFRENPGQWLIKRYILPDGSLVWVDMKLVPLQNSKHLANRHVCIMEDITEFMLANQALQESERMKAVLLANLPGMAYRCLFDRNWTMKFVSQGCLTLTGYEPDCLIDNRDISFNDVILPTYRRILWDEWNRVLEIKQPFRYEYEIVCRNGEHKWVLEQAQAVYDEQGNVEALEGLVIDISEQKLRESQIAYLNDHDFLTGAFNRPYFEANKIQLEKEQQLPVSVIIGDINGMKLINDAFGYTKGDRLLIDAHLLIRGCCREADILARTGGDEFTILMPHTDFETATAVMKAIVKACDDHNSRSLSDIDHISLCLGCSTVTSPDEPVDKAIKEAEGHLVNRKMLNRKSSHNAVLASITATMYEKSRETEQHAERLSRLSRQVGEYLGLSQADLDKLQLFAHLHDIGKVGIDDHILNKPGRLNEDEWQVMKKHTQIGYRIAMATPALEPIAEYILTHHERWDGKGYPRGLSGEQIPMLSRILAVVDTYDAMTENRPYRRAQPKEVALEEIRKHAGTQFDPRVADIFLNEVAPTIED